jgi:DNA repair protein RadC
MKKVFRYHLKMVRERGVTYTTLGGSDESSAQCLKFFKDLLDSPTEALGVIACDIQNRPIGYYIASEGTPNASLVDPRNVFSIALQLMATTIILCHNHPSGDCNPSREDFAVTDRMKQAGELLNITLLDHIIIGNNPLKLKTEAVSIMQYI